MHASAPAMPACAGGDQLTKCEVCMNANKTEVENRIIFITGGCSHCVHCCDPLLHYGRQMRAAMA